MNTILYLLRAFFEEEKWNTIILLVIGFVSNILQANVISYFVSQILAGIQNKQSAPVSTFFKYFIWISIGYGLLNYFYRMFQNKILTKMRQWVRFQLLRMILLVNNENLSGTNFTKMVTPINRVSTLCFQIFTDIVMYIIPNLLFLLVITGLVFYVDVKMGLIFILGNLLWMGYVFYSWESVTLKNKEYEENFAETESNLIEIMNNLDKIIHRGQINTEIVAFSNQKDSSIAVSYDFFSTVSGIMMVINFIILFTMIVCIAFAINIYFQGGITSTMFMTFFTSMMMYKDRAGFMIAQIPDFIEFIGRSGTVSRLFENLHADYDLVKHAKYESHDVDYTNIRFENVSFSYPSTDKVVFADANFNLDTTDNKIIGITGLSGNGKSTLTKLIIKMYKCNKGAIYVNDVDIQHIDTRALRENITYVNQNSKLFDRTVMDNILYGCSDKDTCKKHYDEIMQYPKIRDLYKNVDIGTEKAGFSGEKLSGGQRQIANIISGLVNPSKILILDEPTNALDYELKMELLEVIRYFKPYKQSILIITHDEEVFSLFDENVVV
jgi:ABC-type multidrug transport system fused ATPase/permease subunit